MSPTFLPFLAFMLYIITSAVTLIVFVPMLLIKSRRLSALKALITVLISLPCLISTAIIIAAIFALPALSFSWLASNNYIPDTFGTILALVGLLGFLSLVGVCSLHIWFFLSGIIYWLIEKRPADEYLDKSKVFIFLKPHFGNAIYSFFKKNGIIKIGALLIIIPAMAIAGFFIYNKVSDLTFAKPTQAELIGKYHIIEATNNRFDPSTFYRFKLEFKKDSTFELTPLTDVEVCSKGKYKVDYQFDYNELTFYCGKEVTSAHIDRHFGFYRIEFIIGDPDSGDSIYFEKDK